MTIDRLLMAWKWSVLLNALGLYLPFGKLTGICYQGNVAGVFLPTSLGGDLLRAYLVNRQFGEAPKVYASILMEKVIGFLSAVNWAFIGIIVFGFLYISDLPGNWLAWGGGLCLLVNGLFLLSLHPTVHAWFHHGFARGGKFRVFGFFKKLLDAYSQYRTNRKSLAFNGILTLFEHALQVAIFGFMAHSLGFEVGILLFLSVTAVFLLIYRLPIAPDGWGVGEITAIGLYGLIGISAEEAFALAFLAHVMQTLVVLPGLWFYWQTSHLPDHTLHLSPQSAR